MRRVTGVLFLAGVLHGTAGSDAQPPPPPGKSVRGEKGRNGVPGGPKEPGGPGRVMPPFAQDALGLTAAQRQQIEDLQREVDGRLEKILTPGQRQQLREMHDRGPGGPPRKR